MLIDSNQCAEKVPSLDYCRPDPEEMLARNRRKRDKVKADIEAFESIDDYYFEGMEKSMTILYGLMHLRLKELKKDEDRWLAEIDKD